MNSLAVAIGTAHGIYKGIPKLDVERLSEIRSIVDIPLVLHGTSGVPDDQVRDCVSRGICKVNYATDLRIAYTNGVRKFLSENLDAFDPKKYGAAGRELVNQYVMQKMEVVGSVGKPEPDCLVFRLPEAKTLLIMTDGPGTGKTGLARRLLAHLTGVSVISYGAVKEKNWDRFGFDNTPPQRMGVGRILFDNPEADVGE